MKIILTPQLHEFLIKQGYQFCFSKTTNIQTTQAEVCITLTPVKFKPLLKLLPQSFDTYFNINAEPAQLANGVDDTLIFVNVSLKTILQYFASVLSNRHIV